MKSVNRFVAFPVLTHWSMRDWNEVLGIDDWVISPVITHRWISLDLNYDKSTLVQVMSWCREATIHYLSQCWPPFMSPYGFTRLQWVNFTFICVCVCTPYLAWGTTVELSSSTFTIQCHFPLSGPWMGSTTLVLLHVQNPTRFLNHCQPESISVKKNIFAFPNTEMA